MDSFHVDPQILPVVRKEVQEKPKFWRVAKQLDAALGQAKSAHSWKMETILVSLSGKFAEVKTAGSDVIAYKNTDPQLAIE